MNESREPEDGAGEAGGTGKAGKTRRLFIALPLPGHIRSRLADMRQDLPAGYFRPLKEENIHITLVFLGDTPDSGLAAAESAAREAAEEFAAGTHAPFAAELGGFGAFPHPGEPRVVWVGLSRGGIEAGRLSENLRRRLRRSDLRFDSKPFAAHITVAYARRDLGRAGLKEAGAAFTDMLRRRGSRKPRAGETFEFGEMILMESGLRPGGSVFAPVLRIPVKNAK